MWPPFCGRAPCSGNLFRLVTCPSGRRCNTRNVVWCQSQRGFKSHRHRERVATPLLPFVYKGSGGLCFAQTRLAVTLWAHSPESRHDPKRPKLSPGPRQTDPSRRPASWPGAVAKHFLHRLHVETCRHSKAHGRAPEVMRRDSGNSRALHGPGEPAHVVLMHPCQPEVVPVLAGNHQIIAALPLALLSQPLA